MFEIFGVSSAGSVRAALDRLINGSFYALLSLGLAVIFGMLKHHQLHARRPVHAGRLRGDLSLAICRARLLVGADHRAAGGGATGIVIERLFLRWLYQLDHLYGLLLTFGLALILEGTFRTSSDRRSALFGAASLTGGQNLGFMFLAQLSGLVVAARSGLSRHWFVIERTKLGSYSARRDREPDAGARVRINVPRMITLTYGFGVGLAGLAGVMAAPIYNVSPQMART